MTQPLGPRAVFLDRDGVLNFDRGYVHSPGDFEFIPGALGACRAFAEAGFLLFVVTNQSGIARGLFTEEDFLGLTETMLSRMAAAGAPVSRVYHCPHHPGAAIARYRLVCSCRKPAPGMIHQAAADFSLDLEASALFGDSPRDIEAALRAGVGERVMLGRDGCRPPGDAPGATASFASLADAASSDWFRNFAKGKDK